jgi:hypothetical protein
LISVMLKYQPSYSSFAVAVAYLAFSSIQNNLTAMQSLPEYDASGLPSPHLLVPLPLFSPLLRLSL